MGRPEPWCQSLQQVLCWGCKLHHTLPISSMSPGSSLGHMRTTCAAWNPLSNLLVCNYPHSLHLLRRPGREQERAWRLR